MQTNSHIKRLTIVWVFTTLLLASRYAIASESHWPISGPWSQPSEPAPEVTPFELPTIKGNSPHFNTPIPALKAAPKIDPDTIFDIITHCYPEKSKFKIDLSLVAGVKSSINQYDASNWPDITEHYVGIVGKMPLYSTTEQARERQWEYQRRTATATAVSAFAEALANRNHAYRELGLYLAMEARSQARVRQGVANVKEQVGFLEKVASAQRDILKFEAKVVEQRLTLISMCDDLRAPDINQYLKNIAHLPPPNTSEAQ